MKFKLGDKARVKYVRNCSNYAWREGSIVTIIGIGRGIDGISPYECTVKCADGDNASCLFEQLEPLVPDEVSWSKIEEMTGWSPPKEKANAYT